MVVVNPAAIGGVTAGEWGGYFISGDDLGQSTMGNDFDINLLLVWNAIDGPESESGIGDLLGEDEDGDGTDFDRVFGVPYLSATVDNSTNPLCDITGGDGLVHPVAGDIVDALGGSEALAELLTGKLFRKHNCWRLRWMFSKCSGGVVAACDEAGGVANTVYGQCYAEANGDDFAATSNAPEDMGGGVFAAVEGACIAAGGPATDEEVRCKFSSNLFRSSNAYAAQSADSEDPCATNAYQLPSMSCDDSAGASLCCLASGINFRCCSSPTCGYFAAGFSEEFLDESAAASDATGYQTCTNLSAGLSAGLPAGDAGAIAQLDASAASVLGMSCSEYGSGYEAMCIESVAGAKHMYLMDPSLTNYGLFLTFNAPSVNQYLDGGYTMEDIAVQFPHLLVNDSDRDFDPTCYAPGSLQSHVVVV